MTTCVLASSPSTMKAGTVAAVQARQSRPLRRVRPVLVSATPDALRFLQGGRLCRLVVLVRVFGRVGGVGEGDQADRGECDPAQEVPLRDREAEAQLLNVDDRERPLDDQVDRLHLRLRELQPMLAVGVCRVLVVAACCVVLLVQRREVFRRELGEVS
jgi:hypothetical protein